MLLFISGILLLLLGYFTYGKFIEKLLGPDDRETPALTCADGVDFVVIPHWKNMLIQLLNIAGIGPVIGVILGIKFGAVVFLIIPIGNIIGGAVHDFFSGMMSLRAGGANLPALICQNLGKRYYRFFFVFMIFLLLLVVAVFINIPANLSKQLVSTGAGQAADGGFFHSPAIFWIAVFLIFLYYIQGTLFPIDKIIGRIYPFFGGMLLLASISMLGALMLRGIKDPDILKPGEAFTEQSAAFVQTHPILPMLFVTIACGIISGFHATQSPIIARTMKSEREAKSNFYGMMIAEGIIAMIWAGGGLAIYNMNPVLLGKDPTFTLVEITNTFLGSVWGKFTVFAVIILAITSGDTAMRSLRLSVAEALKINQTKLINRVLLCLPLILIISLLLWWSNQDQQSFNYLWNYFSWGNQVLAASTLMAATSWLIARKKTCLPTLIPGMFMCFIVVSYIAWISPAHKGPYGFGLPLNVSYVIAVLASVQIAVYACFKGKKAQQLLQTDDQ